MMTVKFIKSHDLELALCSWIILISGMVPGIVSKMSYYTSFSKLTTHDLVQGLCKKKSSIMNTHNVDYNYFIKDYF